MFNRKPIFTSSESDSSSHLLQSEAASRWCSRTCPFDFWTKRGRSQEEAGIRSGDAGQSSVQTSDYSSVERLGVFTKTVLLKALAVLELELSLRSSLLIFKRRSYGERTYEELRFRSELDELNEPKDFYVNEKPKVFLNRELCKSARLDGWSLPNSRKFFSGACWLLSSISSLIKLNFYGTAECLDLQV